MTAIFEMLQQAVYSFPLERSVFDRLRERSAIVLKVLITDDRVASRKGLRALMLTQPDIHVIGEAADGKRAIQLIKQEQPDVVIMDAYMPGMNGLEATRIIKKKWQEIRVVFLTLHEGIREEALAAGADAFLVKGCPIESLMYEIKKERRDQYDLR